MRCGAVRCSVCPLAIGASPPLAGRAARAQPRWQERGERSNPRVPSALWQGGAAPVLPHSAAAARRLTYGNHPHSRPPQILHNNVLWANWERLNRDVVLLGNSFREMREQLDSARRHGPGNASAPAEALDALLRACDFAEERAVNVARGDDKVGAGSYRVRG